MEKDRSARLIAIVALVLAVTGVSIGFAVLSTNLDIQPVTANVNANKDLFKIFFSSSSSEYKNESVTPTLTPQAAEGFSGLTINVGANSTTLSGIGGTFTEPGQKITYDLGIFNIGKIDGFLTGITFSNAEGSSLVKCESVTNEGHPNPIEEPELSTACKNIKLMVKVNGTEYTESKANITKQEIEASQHQTLQVIISYDDNATPVTGDFKATFGNIQLTYQTKDNEVM